LKNIGSLIGATWEGSVSHGADSVEVYARWLKEKNNEDLESLVSYNQEDTWATAKLLDWLTEYAAKTAIYQRPFPWTGKSAKL
jgi:predicted RecB family nuclease